jgi:hypothetical protein
MLSKTTVALAAALMLSAAFSASAATRSRVGNANPAAAYASTKYGSRCTASGGPECYTGCMPSGPPCKEEHDGW